MTMMSNLIIQTQEIKLYIKKYLSLSLYSVIVLAVLSPRRAELAKHLF